MSTQPARVEGSTGAKLAADDEQTVFADRVEALRRLCPVKARLLGLIADEMLLEARSRATATA